MALFEVVILELPTKQELEDGTGEERIVFGPEFVVAKDSSTAAIRAIMSKPDVTGKIDQKRMQVLTRPFV